MSNYVRDLDYNPKCPYCESERGFDVAFDEHTVGDNGQYELVMCKECHKVISANSPK